MSTKILNAKTDKVTVERDTVVIKLFCMLGNMDFDCNLKNPVHVKMLEAIMRYTDSKSFEEMEGKIIRVIESDLCFKAFGDPIWDDNFFMTFADEFEELPAIQILEKLKSKK